MTMTKFSRINKQREEITIPYAENKAQPAPDRTLGHKHEVNRDVAQRRQTERTTVNQIREEDTVGE